MRGISLRRPSPAMVVACVALAVVLGGTSYAAVLQVPRSSVGTVQLKTGAVTTKKLAANAVTSAKVRNGSLLKADFRPGQLPAGPTGPQGPAGAPGSPGLSAVERVETTSANNSTTPKSAQIACPAGKRLIGGGARVNGGNPKVALSASFPDNDNIYRATAAESDGFVAAWSVTVYAICAIAN
ncbi:MAG: hypothetical protein H0W35_01210 [Actinobacteria bacterium]|nr:hypothetical protein [Actinomycetota bacterium]MBA3561327.1 hypothetical protein [Actinomycetota bacterium]MBA3566517.1 hypothetical protein [Actinomycetota bacterium]